MLKRSELSSKGRKAISIILKVAILAMAFTFIYRQLNNNKNLRNFKQLISGLSIQDVKLVLCVVFMLMFLNWFLESLKWKFLVKQIENISTWKAIESVFCGLTWAVFTPNRIGEYGGRILFLKPRRRVFGLVAMGVGAAGQMVVTNVLGSVAMLWFIGRFVPLNIWLHYGIAFLVIAFCGFFLLFFFNIRWIDNLIGEIKFLKPFRKFFAILKRYNTVYLIRIFAFCLARFIVFTFQYYLVIHLLIPEIKLFEIAMMIFILFFIQSALPSLDLLDVGVRGMTATYFFSYITTQNVAILTATSCIWLVNLIIPAILGTAFVFKLNFFGTSDN